MFGLFRKDTTPTYEYTVTRHSYNKTNNEHGVFSFEQSFDVYTPTTTTLSSSSPIVVLVMGSGWLGHAPWIYYVTNWWNSGGPKQICHKLGYTCISVRHSGGFIHVLPACSTLVVLLAIVWIKLAVLFQIINAKKTNVNGDDEANKTSLTDILRGVLFDTNNNNDQENYFSIDWLFISMIGICMSLTILKLFHGQGATIDEMVNDVNDSLVYVQSHRQELGLPSHSKSPKLVLGGYSSGAHVAATWYSRQSSSLSSSSTSKKSNVPATNLNSSSSPYKDIVGIMYLSGVLSLDSWLMHVVTWTVFNKSGNDIPSPIQQLPTFSSSNIAVKHLLIGCNNETFGIPILDATFCSKEYVQKLSRSYSSPMPSSASNSSSSSSSSDEGKKHQNETQDFARFVSIPYANHWTILDSQGLVVALQEHLPWLISLEKESSSLKSLSTVPPLLSKSTGGSSSVSSSKN